MSLDPHLNFIEDWTALVLQVIPCMYNTVQSLYQCILCLQSLDTQMIQDFDPPKKPNMSYTETVSQGSNLPKLPNLVDSKYTCSDDVSNLCEH